MYMCINVNSLHGVNYINQIKKIFHNCKTEYSSIEDKGLAWEMTKMKIRAFPVLYCFNKKRKIDKPLKNH